MEGVLIIGVNGAMIMGAFGWAGVIAATVVFEIVGPAIIHWSLEQKIFQRYAACVPIQFWAGIATMIVSAICVGF